MQHDPAKLAELRYYTLAEIVVLIEKAYAMEIPLEAGSWIENLTISQLEKLVNGYYEC